MRMRILKYFVETGIARNIPYSFSPGEEVDAPAEIAKQWQKRGLAKPITESAAFAAPKTAMKPGQQPRKRS